MCLFNCPDDEYSTNVFNQVIILFEDLSEKAKTIFESIKPDGKNE